MPKMNKYDAAHQRNLRRYQKQIDKIYDAAVKEAASIAGLVHGLGDDKIFSFSDYPLTQRRIAELLDMLAREVEAAIVNGVRSEWTLANNKNDALCDRVFGDSKLSLTKEEQRRYYSNNDSALKAFMERKESGLSLSDRVWRYTDLFKHEIELGIDVGIRSGKSAALMARDLKQFLKFPDKLFRRVRDEHGMLKLSQAAKAFHPGRGVYRSSYKNARRLAATETNMAYRTADHDRWQDLDFVVGQEIKLSGNHTCLGADGKPHPFYDICDELKGKYPKDFKFVGWHPHCRCFSVPVMKSMDEIKADTQRILRGEEVDGESHDTVKDLPNNFKDWIRDNAERTARAKSLPYFIKDNSSLINKTNVVGDISDAISNNNKELSVALSVRQGKAMNFTEADEGRSNPNYVNLDAQKEGYYDNCQTCTVAYELRRRGFDVEALPNKSNEFYKKWCVKNSFDWRDRFVNEDGTRPQYAMSDYSVADTIQGKLTYIERITQDYGRYEVYCSWKKTKCAHVFIVERQRSGNLLWFDPQSGKKGSAFDDYLKKMKAHQIGIMRIDDKMVNPAFAARLKDASQ